MRVFEEMFHGMKVADIIKRNLSRAAAGRTAHKAMRKREDATGKQIYYGPGITKKRKRRLANLRARLKRTLERQQLEERKKNFSLHPKSTSQ